jgi:hypothetical protein
VISPLSWNYHLTKDSVTVDRIEQAYIEGQNKQSLLGSLRAAGIRVMDIGPEEKGDMVVQNIRRMSR